MTAKSANTKKKSGLGEFIRKRLVGLKRKPQIIALLVLVAAFVWYSFNLTAISDTTARINKPGMGLSGFATMLFSILSLVCFINTYPHRKPTNNIMLGLTIAMLAVLVCCDFFYIGRINEAVNDPKAPLDLAAQSLAFVGRARSVLSIHWIIVVAGAVLQLLLPVYRPLIKSINTSIDLEYSDDMAAIDIEGDD